MVLGRQMSLKAAPAGGNNAVAVRLGEQEGFWTVYREGRLLGNKWRLTSATNQRRRLKACVSKSKQKKRVEEQVCAMEAEGRGGVGDCAEF